MAITRLKLVRKKLGITQLELAAKTGIHIPDIYRLEHGLLKPYKNWKERIALALNYPLEKIDELFEIVEDSDK